ncbi:MAG: HIT family protein [Candidatus Aenigmarchaeota archaeon]|nr:HIT family protein [Candidatus Aenigmarchaeota archaeon]
MDECIFCQIASGKMESFKVYEDDDSFAFLDIHPAAPGHTLVVPKKHTADIFDIDEISLRRLAGSLRHIASKIKNAIGSDIMIMQNNGRAAGQIVDHIHFHVIPRTEGDGIGLMRGMAELTKEQMEEIQNKIKEASSDD